MSLLLPCLPSCCRNWQWSSKRLKTSTSNGTHRAGHFLGVKSRQDNTSIGWGSEEKREPLTSLDFFSFCHFPPDFQGWWVTIWRDTFSLVCEGWPLTWKATWRSETKWEWLIPALHLKAHPFIYTWPQSIDQGSFFCPSLIHINR